MVMFNTCFIANHIQRQFQRRLSLGTLMSLR